MRLTIAYTKKGSITGLELFKALKDSGRFTWVKRTYKSQFDANTDVLIRWGDAHNYNTKVGCKIINSKESVINASNKAAMMRILAQVAEIRQPVVVFSPTSNTLDTVKDSSNKFYVRGSDGAVRYDDRLKSGDVYATKPISRIHEYRVQVFNGNIIGIYEKMPENPEQKLFKGYNCHFRKLDPSICSCKKDGQKMAIDAVKAMGLVSGGVDVIKDKYNRYFINEVNSAFGLNSINILKFKDLFIQYIFGN
jgi:glutathione synthase/RimK-type ligase-like ATP-grasp enzyme